MINKIFLYNNVNGKIELNVPEILLVSEFNELMDNKRNITKEDPKGIQHTRAFREFTYIYLAIQWDSVYADYSPQERHREALKDAKITEQEFNDPQFRAACRKFKQLQDSNRSIRMLHSAQQLVDRFIDYFNNVDPQERDEQTGKPIYKVKDLQAEIANLSKVNEELKTLEGQVKKEIVEQSTIRGQAEDGFIPTGF